jgi:hypothetical protein
MKAQKFTVRWIGMVGSLSTDYRPALKSQAFGSKAEADAFRNRVSRRESFLGFPKSSISNRKINQRLEGGLK